MFKYIWKLGHYSLIIHSYDGLWPVWCQAIWTNADIFVNWIFRNKLQWTFNQRMIHFIQENAFENVVCNMSAILYGPQGVEVQTYWGHYSYHQLFILLRSIFVHGTVCFKHGFQSKCVILQKLCYLIVCPSFKRFGDLGNDLKKSCKLSWSRDKWLQKLVAVSILQNSFPA